MEYNLSSKNVQIETYEFCSVTIPVGASDPERDYLLKELEVFNEDYNSPESLAPVERVVNADGTVSYRFSIGYSMHGQDLNPQTYHDILQVEDVIKRGKRWLP